MLLTSINVGIQAISDVEDAGRAAAMYAFMRTLGMSIGVAVGGTVFQNLMTKKLQDLGLPIEIAHNSEAFVAEMAVMDRDDPVRIGALEACKAIFSPFWLPTNMANKSTDVKGFHGVYWTITGCAFAAFLVSLVIKRHSMDKLLASKFVLKGARASTLAALIAVETNEADLISRLPQLAKSSSRPAQPECHCPQNMETPKCDNDKPCTSAAAQLETPAADPGRSLTPTVAVTVAVAYYVEPDGKRIPFDIMSTTAKAQAQEDSADTRPELEKIMEKVYEGDSVPGSETSESDTSGDGSSMSDEPESQQTTPEEGSIQGDDISRASSPEQDVETTPTTATQSVDQLPEEIYEVAEAEDGAQSQPDEETLEVLSEYATWEALFEEKEKRGEQEGEEN